MSNQILGNLSRSDILFIESNHDEQLLKSNVKYTARLKKRILSSHTVELMGTNHLNEKQYEDFQSLQFGYGYGLGVRTHTDKTISGSLSPLGEFGWDGAAGAFSMVDPKNNLSLTYFQHIHGWDKRIQREMRNALYAGLEY